MLNTYSSYIEGDTVSVLQYIAYYVALGRRVNNSVDVIFSELMAYMMLSACKLTTGPLLVSAVHWRKSHM